MCKSCEKFLNHHITLTDGTSFSIGDKIAVAPVKSIIYGQDGRVKPKLQNSFAEKYTTTESKFTNDMKNYLDDVSSRIFRLFEPAFSREPKLLYVLGNCKQVVLDKNFMEQFIFKSFGIIDSLIINTKDYTKEALLDYQMEKIGTKGGLSVANIFRKISNITGNITLGKETNPNKGNKILALLFLKTLADLSLTMSCFYYGINETISYPRGKLQKVNFLATFDRTSAAIATTLSRDNQPLYRNILLQVPGQGISAYLDDDTRRIFLKHEEANVEDILKLGDMSVKSNEQIKNYELASKNCNYFKKYIQDNTENPQLQGLDCYKEYNSNWTLLEPNGDTLQGQEVLESMREEQELNQTWGTWLISLEDYSIRF